MFKITAIVNADNVVKVSLRPDIGEDSECHSVVAMVSKKMAAQLRVGSRCYVTFQKSSDLADEDQGEDHLGEVAGE